MVTGNTDINNEWNKKENTMYDVFLNDPPKRVPERKSEVY